MDFFLFCLLNAVLFLRPAELVEGLIGLPIYMVTLLATVAAAYPQMVKKLQPSDLAANPINLCVLGLLLSVPLSHLQYFDLWHTRHSFMNFGKTAMYYLLFVAVIRTERRLDQFLKVLLVLIGAMTSLSLMHHHDVIHLPQLDAMEQRTFDPETGELFAYDRLRSTGLFNDPNDLAMILVVGLVLAAHFFLSGNILTQPLWLGFMGAMAYAIVLTRSRGGFLALFAAALVFAYARWGWKRAAVLGAILLPLFTAAVAIRGDVSLDSGTGQGRIQLWSAGFSVMKHRPLFGIGYRNYAREANQVAHNSFVNSYVDLGLLGGTMFFGCFYFAFRSLYLQNRHPEIFDDRRAQQRTVAVLALLAGAGAAMLTLSRAYTVPVYTYIGIAAMAAQFHGALAPETYPPVERRLVRELMLASFVFLAITYLFTRVMVRWG